VYDLATLEPKQLMSKRDRGCSVYTLAEVQPRPGEGVDDTFYRVLNNFLMHFSEGGFSYRPLIRDTLKKWDRSPSERPCDQEERAKISHRKWNQTFQEFYETLDLTVGECGYSLADVDAALAFFDDRQNEREARYNRLWRILQPIYTAMRKKGYSISDLRS